MKKVFCTIQGVVLSVFLIVNLLISGAVIALFGLIAHILPFASWRFHFMKFVLKLPDCWMAINKAILLPVLSHRLKVKGTGDLRPDRWYMLISNHRSWVDIVILGCIFNFKIPIIKFFMKKELLWSLPIAGLAAYLIGYPFMGRHTSKEIRKNPELKGKDIETTKKACEKFKLHPTTIMNFVEGTRFTETKKTNMRSPFQNLLKPKSGGTATVIQEMHEKLSGIISTTIFYYPSEKVGVWDLLIGNIKEIKVYYELIEVPPQIIGNYYQDREFRRVFQNWLNDLWQQKDKLIEQWKESVQR